MPHSKQALNTPRLELMDLNPSAAGSLAEGIEESLSVHRLHPPMQLSKTIASTNVIESALSSVEQACRNVQRRRESDQRERWEGSGLPAAD
jgi:putative transposase